MFVLIEMGKCGIWTFFSSQHKY